MTEERVEGPTPRGGAYMIAYYQDADGEPTEKDEAVLVEIVEYDGQGNQISRIYGEVG